MDTFVVRVWIPADNESLGTVFQEVVRHVTTGVERPFRCTPRCSHFFAVPPIAAGKASQGERRASTGRRIPERRPPSEGSRRETVAELVPSRSFPQPRPVGDPLEPIDSGGAESAAEGAPKDERPSHERVTQNAGAVT
jgi:hypothetical protein